MNFVYSPTAVRETTEGHRFRIKRLQIQGRGTKDVSHLVDRSYDYSSTRELRWHLAERFSLPPTAVTLSAA
jgi:hypothetical protein